MVIDTQRSAFVRLRDGALLFDHPTGVLFRLNITAAFVWERLLADVSIAHITKQFSEHFAISYSRAQMDVTAARTLPTTPVFPKPPGDFCYELQGQRYRYSFQDRPIFEIDRVLGLRKLGELAQRELTPFLNAISPKILALLGTVVLHASAVLERNGSVTAFSGLSGAGKTTTARAFASGGRELVSEDKLVVLLEGAQARVCLRAEQTIERWVRSTTEALSSASPNDWIDVSVLREAAMGPTAPLERLLFIDSRRRSGHHIALDPLPELDAGSELFQNIFFGSDAPEDWRCQLTAAATLATRVSSFRAVMPAGISRLAPATTAYYNEVTKS